MLATILGVSLMAVPFAEAKTYKNVDADTLNISPTMQLKAVATTQTLLDNLDVSKPVTYNQLVATLETDTTKPEPSFAVESNTQLLVQATILSTEADMLTDKVTNLSTSMEEELEALKVQIQQKKEEQRQKEIIEQLKNTNPDVTILPTSSFAEFIETAKQHQFANYDARTPSNLTGEELNRFVQGTALEGLGDAYATAEKEYGVSAFVLLALSVHESGWGKSRIAQDKNNLFGYMAYDSSPYASAKHFETKDEAVMTVASHLSRNYLTAGAKYFNGYTLAGMNVRYASDTEWNTKITSIMNRLVAKY